ncbi:MAG: RdgB/HAM1 family non-canonical purine NTP pyrophosphatase [Candidatus Fimenecus sp.]
MENRIFLIATHNKKKLSELKDIFEKLKIIAKSPDELGIEIPDPEETGKTFEENAFIKAKSGFDATGLPTVADDSGLCVDILNGAPGVYSARYSGEHGDDEKNNDLLLKNLEGFPQEKRNAHYVCSICCVLDKNKKFTVRGEFYGRIGFERIGNGGFGYDPLFMVGDKSVAEMTAEEKNKISHRGKALKAFFEELNKYI